MNNFYNRFSIVLSKIQKQHIQYVIVLIIIVMLVLGAGAPDAGGPF